MKYIVIATIANDMYLTKVAAASLCGAEHQVMDMGICGRHEYGVKGATAFDAKGMKTDTFAAMVMKAEPVSIEELAEIIEAENARIRAKDEAEAKILEIEKQMKQLTEELEAAKRVLAA